MQHKCVTRKAATVLCCLLLISLVLFAGLSLTACTSKVVDFAVGAVRTIYTVDETFDFNGAKLKVRYANNTEAFVNVSADMVHEFNTATSGEKICKIKYQGIQRVVAYSVLGNIKTETRIVMDEGAGAEFIIRLENVTFPIYAAKFVLKGDISEINGELKPLVEQWKTTQNKQESSIMVLLYSDNGNPISQNCVLFNFLCDADSAFSISEIEITSADAQYELPNVILKIVE